MRKNTDIQAIVSDRWDDRDANKYHTMLVQGRKCMTLGVVGQTFSGPVITDM